MEYRTCLLKCIEQLRSDGDEEAARLMTAYPEPSAEEWDECMAEVHLAGEDLSNPFHIMGRYDLRLSPTTKTALSLHVARLRESAIEAGIPPEHVDDAVILFARLNDEKTPDDTQ